MTIESIAILPDVATPEERAAKFKKGDSALSDIWTAKPDISECWRGDYREWRIEDGPSFQSQLYCTYLNTWTNPSGATCALCRAFHLPLIEEFRHYIIPAIIANNSNEAAADALVKAVESGELMADEAKTLGEEFELS